MVRKSRCKKCKAAILPATAERNGGLCAPCRKKLDWSVRYRINHPVGASIIAEQLGLGKAFFAHLIEGPSWVFVIALSAFLETVVSSLLREGEAATNSSRSSMSFGQKLSLLSDLRLLGKKHVRFLRALSQLRNEAVHDITSFNCDLKTSFAKDKGSTGKRLARDLAFILEEQNYARNVKATLDTDPHLVIMLGAYDCLDSIHLKQLHGLIAEAERVLERARSDQTP